MGRLTQTAGRNIQLVGAGTLAGLTAATVAAGRFEQQLEKLEATSTATDRSIDRTREQVNRLRGEFNQTTGEVVALVTQLNQLGQGGRDVRGIASEFIRLSAVTGEATGALVSGMVSLQRQMGTEGRRNTEAYAAQLFHLSENAGVGAQNVLNFANAIAPVSRMARMSQTEIMGFSTAFSRAGQDGLQAANAYTTLVNDITRSIEFGSPAVQGYANLIGVTAEQLRAMPTADIVTNVFEEITRQGPAAIRTLERFGLDGIRTYRAFAAIAAQGGVEESMGLAREGLGTKSLKTFEEAYKDALGGLNDEMGKLSNNVNRIVQAFGSGLLPVFTQMAGVVNTLLGPIASLVESLGELPGVGLAVAAGLTMGVGTMVRGIPALIGLAGATMLGRNAFTAGIRQRRGLGADALWVQRATAAYNDRDPRMGPVQRLLYGAGTRIGGIGMGGDGGRDIIGGIRRTGSWMMGLPIRALGWATRMQFDPLQPRSINDIANRFQFFGGGPDAGSGGQGAPTRAPWYTPVGVAQRGAGALTGGLAGMQQSWQRITATMSATFQSVNSSAAQVTRANTQQAQQAQRLMGVTRAVTTEMRALAGAVASASRGALMLGAGIAGRGIQSVGGMAMRGLSGALGMVGGPVGAALLAGGFALMDINRGREAMQEALSTEEDISVFAPYNTALGEATQATKDFAQVLRETTNERRGDKGGTAEDPFTVSRADIERAQNPNYGYTEPRFANMSEAQATQHASLLIGGTASQERKLAVEQDLLRRFGDPAVVQRIMKNAAKKPDIEALWGEQLGANIPGWRRATGLVISDEFAQGIGEAVQTTKGLLASTPPEYRAAVEAVIFEDMIKGVMAETDPVARRAMLKGVVDVMGLGDSEEDLEALRVAVNKAIDIAGQSDPDFTFDAMAGFLRKSNTQIGRQFNRITQERDRFDNRFGPRVGNIGLDAMNALAAESPTSSWGTTQVSRLRGTRIGRPIIDALNWENPFWGPPDPHSAQNVAADLFGATPEATYLTTPEQLAQGRYVLSPAMAAALPTGIALTRAVESPENIGLQQAAAVSLAQYSLLQEGDFAKAIEAMQEWKGVIGDTEDQFYQIADAGKTHLEMLQNEELAYASTAERVKAAAVNLDSARQYLEQNPLDAFAFGDFMQRRQQFMEAREAFHQRNIALVVGKREMDISIARSEEDFTRQKGYADYDFNLQRQHQLEDFNRNRQRQEEAYGRTLERTWRDYNLSRSRQEFDFQLQRRRSEEDYARTLQRSQRDYNLSRTRALFDYNLQRRRAEEDFNHNMVLMAQQSARQVYNAFERVSVARTLSGTNLIRNLEDQQRRLVEQLENLEKARALGLSNDAIRMLGLNEASGAQQLARLLLDAQNNPELIAQLNKLVKDRTGAAGSLVMDEANSQWEEMRRQFNLAMERGAEDFNRQLKRQEEDFRRGLNDMRIDFNTSMTRAMDDYNRARKRQAKDFATSLADQRTDFGIAMEQAESDFKLMRDRQLDAYNVQWQRMRTEMLITQERMRDDFSRNAEEVAGSFEEISEKAAEGLTGIAKAQHEETAKILKQTRTDIDTESGKLVQAVNRVLNKLGLTGLFETISLTGRGSGGTKGGGKPVQMKAEGGVIEGWSPHARADNIPALLTAGEYVQPVHTTQYYGKEVMDALRERRIPREVLQRFADGGEVQALINFGRHLLKLGYQVGEHPLFGGVHPTAHLPTSRGGLHYVGKAIDVNYDGFGQARENQMLDRTIPMAERAGLGYIWRAKDHWDHAHFDTSNRRRLNERTWLFRGGGSGTGGFGDTDEHGHLWDKQLYEELNKQAAFKRWEAIMGSALLAKRYIPNGLSHALAVLAMLPYSNPELMDDKPYSAPQGVERWRSTVNAALQMIGQPRSLADITLRRMNQESGGNPRAINLWDSNAKRGTPSKGLMQVIDPTFEAYKHPELINDIWNPMSNIVASMRYALARYGSIYKAYSRRGGYANGGLVTWHRDGGIFTSPRMVGVAEGGSEAILPLNATGAEFLAAMVRRVNGVDGHDYRSAYVGRNGIPVDSKQIIYHSQVDHSTNINGPITVQANDPDEFLRKMEQRKRHAALIGRNRG